MSSGIFNPQNRFWQTLDHFADLLILSLLWLVCSLPLVTAGAACAALYDAVARCVRGAEPLPWKRFWQTIRRELPCAAAVTVAWGALPNMLHPAMPRAIAAASRAAWIRLMGIPRCCGGGRLFRQKAPRPINCKRGPPRAAAAGPLRLPFLSFACAVRAASVNPRNRPRRR